MLTFGNLCYLSLLSCFYSRAVGKFQGARCMRIKQLQGSFDAVSILFPMIVEGFMLIIQWNLNVTNLNITSQISGQYNEQDFFRSSRKLYGKEA